LLISDKGEKLGPLDYRDAKNIAKEQGFDFVLVNDADIPVFKMMDEGKYKYEKKKKQKNSSSKNILKEVTMGYKIAEHDYQIRLKRIRKFLEKKQKVKVTIRLRGRERQHYNLACELRDRIVTDSSDFISGSNRLKGSTSQVMVILDPKK
jgi:translation initiation factor IF-3